MKEFLLSGPPLYQILLLSVFLLLLMLRLKAFHQSFPHSGLADFQPQIHLLSPVLQLAPMALSVLEQTLFLPFPHCLLNCPDLLQDYPAHCSP